MKRIHSISLNTAVDVRIVIRNFSLGEVIRSEGYKEFAAGKAVNNSRAIACLGHRVTLYCFTGRNDVTLFSSINSLVESKVLPVDGITRRNLTLVRDNGELICHIQNSGYSVDQPHLDALEGILNAEMKKGDIVIISGSIPKGTPRNYLNLLVQSTTARGMFVILDVDPVFLAHIDCSRVALVKPNLQELSRLAGKALVNLDEIISCATKMLRAPIVVVSLGKDGALWIDQRSGRYIKGHTNLSISGNSDVIGCGDAMVGAIALGFAKAKNPADILKMGISAGYANIFAEGPGVLSPEHYEAALESTELIGENVF